MNVEAQVTWTDGERFVANASSGHGIVIDSDGGATPQRVPWKWSSWDYAPASPRTL